VLLKNLQEFIDKLVFKKLIIPKSLLLNIQLLNFIFSQNGSIKISILFEFRFKYSIFIFLIFLEIIRVISKESFFIE